MFHHLYGVVEMCQPRLVGQLKNFMELSTAVHHGLAIYIQGNRREDVDIATQVVQPPGKQKI